MEAAANTGRCATRHPIMLIHGTGGRDRRRLSYWGRIPKALQGEGAAVFTGGQDSWGTIEDNAEVLRQSLQKALEETGAEKLNLIAHSKGGLDARYLISRLGMAEQVASLTTLSTPHHGSRTMEKLCRLPAWLFRLAALFVNGYFRLLGDKKPDFAAVCRVVKGMRRFTIGAIGARTTKFMTVRFDELALQKAGISVKSYDLSELFARVKKMDGSRAALAEKKAYLQGYSDFSLVPENKLDTLARTAVAIDDMIAQYQLDSISLRCWEEMQSELGIAPCVLLGALNDSGVAASCEMDLCNAVAMRALSLASEEPAACLDWNNNYGGDPDKCILFHCGPIARSLMEPGSGCVGNHKMFTKEGDPNCGWGCDEGRIAAMDMTYASGRTDDGKFYIYTGKGEFTGEPIEPAFFGCGGVARIEGLQEKLLYIGKNGYRHHVSATRGDCLKAINEAFETYLGYELVKF